MKKCVAEMLALFLAGTVLLSGCNLQNEEKEAECPYEEFIVVDVFDSLANYQGIQSGWFAKIVKDKFNMELNIIAPNVAGGGDTLFETRAAAGNLGDLIICNSENGTFQDLVTEGLLYNIEPFIREKEMMRFESAIRSLNDNAPQEGIYAIPAELAEQAPTETNECLEPTFGPYIRWDLYEQLGYPEMKTLEDLLPVLKQMQELEPVTEEGKKTYGISFFRDWDDNLMNAAKQPCCFYGYDESGFVLVSADGSDYQNIIDNDSLYIRVLKWYFDANRMGLVDPESPTQTYEDFQEKYETGQILYAPWPWVAQTQYNTYANKQQGKGFMMADIEDMKIYSYGCSPAGNQKSIIAVGSKAQDPERMADFINWLYSPEGISANGVMSIASTAGPEGLCWEYGEDGPYLTEFGKKALLEGDASVPEEWGGGSFAEGISELNFMTVGKSEKDDKGYPYHYLIWDSVLAMEETPLDKDWREKMGAKTTLDYLIENDKLLVTPGYGYTQQTESSEEAAIRKQCKAAIQKYSWSMIFAETEEEFYQLLEQMQKEVNSLGYEQIFAFDMECTKEKEAVKQEMLENYVSSK